MTTTVTSLEEKIKIKILGQFNTKPTIIDFIIKQVFFPKEKNIDILEPSSGEGNFIVSLKNYGYNNITAYEIDPKYKDTGAIISDFLKTDIHKKFDLVIGNPPFTSLKITESYYDDEYGEFQTRFIEMCFLEKCLKLLKDNGKLIFIFPNRLFLDTKFNKILRQIYNTGFYINHIIDLPLNIFTNTQSTTSVLICISKQPSAVFVDGIQIPIQEFLEDSNYYLYKEKEKYICKEGVCLGDLIEKMEPPEETDSKVRITVGTLDLIKYKNNNYLAIVRNGNSSAGKFTLYDPEKYYFNECFYFYRIKNGYTKDVIKLMESDFYKDYIKLISKRTGSKSIRTDDLLKLRIK
jgi:hypothetical protein